MLRGAIDASRNSSLFVSPCSLFVLLCFTCHLLFLSVSLCLFLCLAFSVSLSHPLFLQSLPCLSPLNAYFSLPILSHVSPYISYVYLLLISASFALLLCRYPHIIVLVLFLVLSLPPIFSTDTGYPGTTHFT